MIVVFGSLNVDLVFSLPALPQPGETVLTDSYGTVPGGKGANQAVAAARALAASGAVVMVGCVGEDGFGALVLDAMREAGVEVGPVIRSRRPTGCASIAVDRAGRNAIAVASGANRDAAHTMVPDAWLGPGTVLLLQNEVPIAQNLALAGRAAARGARVILNAAPAHPLPAEDWRGVLSLLVVNETELESLAGHGPEAAAMLAGAFNTAVLATRGADGAMLTAPDGGGWRVGALPLNQVVDTTAAGDGFVGALAAALYEGFTMPEALRRASVAGGLACTRAGAQPSLPTRAEIEARLADLPSPEPL